MTTQRVKPLVRFIAPLLLVCAYSSAVLADPQECAIALFEYADNYPIEKLGAKIDVKLTQEPSLNGKPGSVINIRTYSSEGNMIMERECDTCWPEKSRIASSVPAAQILPCCLGKGSNLSQITKVLGQSYQIQDNEMFTCYVDESGCSDVTVYLKNGRLTSVVSYSNIE